jgi:glycosyltransferase involved in cell wall biosynthesis
MAPSVSVIIPTCANQARAPFLMRAIDSLLSGQHGLALPVVAVNGSSYVPEVLEGLRRRRDIRCLYFAEAGTTNARHAARKAVDTEFFGMLDDDDEYLPGGIEIQLEPMLLDDSVDAVVTNGYRRENGKDSLHFPSFSTFHLDPLKSLMEWSWLNSGGLVCRSATVPPSYLEVPRSMELTYMAMKLALTRKLRFVDAPTYCWHRDAPEQLSGSKYYMEGAPDGIGRMMRLNPPARIKRRLARKYAAALHYLSDRERTEGNYGAAWQYHLKSLLSVHGIKYLAYTRFLLHLSRERRLETRTAGRR